MAKTISDIKEKLGITQNTSFNELLELARTYEVITQAEINNLKSISILPLPTNVKNQAEELKKRFTNIVLDENKGALAIDNCRFVILTELAYMLVDILETKVNSSDIIDNLLSNSNEVPLSAKQGKILKGLIDDINTAIGLLNDTLATKSNSADVYTKNEENALLDTKADKTNTPTKTEMNTALGLKANQTDLASTQESLSALSTKVSTMESVQNVVDIVATKSALNSYVTSKLEENDKIQVIADETKDSASTIYNWNGTAWEYVGAYGGNSYPKVQTYNRTETLEQIDLHKLINVTYADLVTLKTNNNLVPGQLYRITDYVTKTNGKCNNYNGVVRSVEHPFDIVVRAIASNKFAENARAILHTNDMYFANNNLEAWKLWYCFDNDSNRFEWADTSTGKGVIYRMIDEFGNDLPYDFKNIQFKRYKITATSDQRQANAIGKYFGFNGNYSCTSDSTDYQWYFTFSKRSNGTDNGNDLSIELTEAPSYQNCYYVKQVKISPYLTDNPNYRGTQALNNIVFECENIIVDVQIGAGSHHNTLIGNKDITYVYFKEMFRNNILMGEMSHTRADECFEQNMIGDFLTYSNLISWNKFSHHFKSNTALYLENNDFEGQVSNCKFPEKFIRNHIFNLWDSVNAGTHDTFLSCDLGYMVNVTLSGAGDWNGVRTISCYNVTIKVANLYGSVFNRMEYVILSQNNSVFNISNLTVGAIYGSSSKILNIALGNLVNRNSVYEKRIDWAYNTGTENKSLIYTFASYDATNYIMDNYSQIGTIGDDGTVTWDTVTKFFTKIDNIKMNKTNPTGTGAMTMNGATASNYGYANGSGATASGIFSRAIGFGATASGGYSLAVNGTASGSDSIAYGNSANASGNSSIAFGDQCKAKGNNQVVTGKFNIPDTSSLEIVGNGAYMNTKNARVLDGNGNEFLAGDLYLDTEFSKDSNGDLLSKQGMSVKQAIKNIQSALDGNLYNETNDNGIAYEVALSNPLPYGKVNKVGGMSYKSENLLVIDDVAETERQSFKYKISNGKFYIKKFVDDSTSSNAIINLATPITFIANKTYYLNQFNTNNTLGIRLLDNDNTTIISLEITANGTFTPTETKVATKIQWFGSGEYNVELVYSPMITENSVTEFKQGFSGIRNTAVSQLIVKGVNLLQLSDVAETSTSIGLTYSIQDGVITLNGTTTGGSISIALLQNISGNNFVLSAFNPSIINSMNMSIRNTSNVAIDNILFTSINNSKSITTSETIGYIGFYIGGEKTFTNYQIKPMLVSGSTAPTEYKPYVTPIIKTIPSQIQALDGYGWGFTEDICNYFDDTKKYYKKFARIDMGILDWFISSGIFVANLSDIKPAPTSNTVGNIMCANYTSVAWSNIGTDKSICVISTATQIRVNDSEYTTASSFKTAMSGIYLYYELATPIETDVSQYLTDENYDVLPNLEPNGSITLDNTYQQEAVYDITTLEKVSV